MTCGTSLRRSVLERSSGSAFVDPSGRSSVRRIEMFWKRREVVGSEVPKVTVKPEVSEVTTKPGVSKVTVNELHINLSTMKGPLVLQWAPWEESNATRPWRFFLKWYFSKESPAYWLTTDIGGVMIRRQDIISFKIQVLEKQCKL